jgi:hypothetical protein
VYKITPARADPAVRFARAKLIKARHEALTKEGKGRPPFYIFADESWAWARSYKKGRFCDRGDTKRPSAPRKTSFLSPGCVDLRDAHREESADVRRPAVERREGRCEVR